ncbi:MAG: succinate dehydrogenase, cytochrome b556 subunit, partial [Burkholderiaceae bacterium]|nr:succinate dehydrogenase, cytochrome b556 subunit [Burkholderiaceae bacterium]
MSTVLDPARKRPEFRNIHVTQIVRYRLPPAGIVSILHRVSGALLFLLLPFLVWIFELSVSSELSFARLKDVASHWF